MGFVVNVPDAPGVPAVLFAATAIADPLLLTADALSLFQGSFSPIWGIFLSGTPIVVCDNVVSVDYKQEYTVSDFPLEQGAFESYDKVQVPFDARVRFSSGGSSDNRAALLASIQAIVGDLNLYDVVTPEAVYSSVNIVHQDYRRTSMNGVGLIQIDVWLQEVRVVSGATGSLSSTQQPSGADPTNGGTVQPTAPTTTQTATVPTVVGPPQNFPGQP